ncbi:MAG: response regulator [Deltaproteobacteria bacterium]|nr:response regulator [Deltaproteobacteria bacterium]
MTVEILLVEDNQADVLLLSEVLETEEWSHCLHAVEDGVEALDFLYRRHAHANAPRPDLILMDLNTPRKNGSEVLAEIRTDPVLAHIPVIILSGSPWERDTLSLLGIPEERYLIKPMTYQGYLDVVQQIQDIWRRLGRAGSRDLRP